MTKKQMFRILARAEAKDVAQMADRIRRSWQVTIIQEPQKGLAMIKMREPVKESLFYLGEVIISEAAVELEGARGAAVVMGDDFEKTLNMAVIDAACNKGVFEEYDRLLQLEEAQTRQLEKENAMFMKTKVSFNSMTPEVQS